MTCNKFPISEIRGSVLVHLWWHILVRIFSNAEKKVYIGDETPIHKSCVSWLFYTSVIMATHETVSMQYQSVRISVAVPKLAEMSM